MGVITVFIQKAIGQGVCILFGANGEILTEKSGNLNLGVPGMMYMGGIAGLAAAFMYERAVETPNAFVGFLLALLAALLAGGLGGLIYSVLTITLRANQNVSGLALTTFGVGLGNFFGGSLSKLAGGVGQISTAATASAFRLKLPLLSDIPVLGDVLFSYGLLTYLAIAVSIVLSWYLNRTRQGLCLRAVGENPATADAAGINVSLYKYLATVIGGAICGPGRAVLRDGVLRRHLDQQRLRRPRLAGRGAGHLRPLASAERHLGLAAVRRAVHPLPVHPRPGPRHPGDLQDAALRGHHHRADPHQPAQEEGGPAPGEPGPALLPRGRQYQKRGPLAGPPVPF